MKLKVRSPKDFTFLLKIRENEMVRKGRGRKKDTEVKTLRKGVGQSRDLILAAEIHGYPVNFFVEKCNVISFSFFKFFL